MPWCRLFFSCIFCFLVCVGAHAPICANICEKETPVVKHLKHVKGRKPYSGVSHVGCVYVINLDKRPEKWARMEQILKEKGIYALRFSAIDGWNIPLSAQQELAGDYPVRMLPGEVGCFLSHVSVIRHALKSGHNVVWIFEDDIEFVEDPHQMSSYIAELNALDPDWDILYTDIDSKNNQGISVPALDADFRPDRTSDEPLEHYLKRTPLSDGLMRLGQRYGMYSFLISKKGMRKIYHYFSHVYLWSAIDIDIHYIPSIREYSVTRDIVSIWCDSPFSDTKDEATAQE